MAGHRSRRPELAVQEPKAVPGARPPLFERLSQSVPVRRDRPFRILTLEEVKDSVTRELLRLLNTRSLSPAPDSSVPTGSDQRLVLYGVPDSTSFSGSNKNDRIRLADGIARAIARFEPRLRDVVVEVVQARDNPVRAIVRIDGNVVIGRVVEPVSFVVDDAGEPCEAETPARPLSVR
jgi:type VI secretion system lysozyme-like protein